LSDSAAAIPDRRAPQPISPAWSWAVILLFAIVYLGAAFTPALQDDADSTHAEAAREMLVSGDYVTLHVNGVRYLEKAPLMYWMVAASYRVFGVNEFAVRFPTVLAMFLLVLLAMRWGRRAFGDRAGIYAGLFVTTAAGCFLFTRILIPEAILSLLIAACFFFFLTALDFSQAWRWYAGYACLALAVLTKGLVALVFVGITSFVYVVVSGQWRRWREFRMGTGLLLFLLIAAPWHLLAGFRNPRFFWFYFVNEHFLRFLGKRYPKDYNKVPAALYWSLHLVWLFPWSLYLPLAIRNIGRDLKEVRENRAGLDFAAQTRVLCWIWGGLVLAFFALSTSQEYYTFPAYFPILLLIAAAIAADERSHRTRWLVATTAVIAVIALVAGGVLIAGLWSSRHLSFEPDISTVLAKHNMAEDTLSMSHFMDLTGESFAALRLPAILAAIALIVGPALAFWLRRRGRHYAGTWALGLTMGVFLVAAHIALDRFGSYLSSRPLAADIARMSAPGDEVAIYGDQAYGSSLLFYLKRPILLVNGRTTSMWFGSTYPDAPHIYLDDEDLLRTWNSTTRIFLFVPEHEKPKADSLLAGNKYLIAENSGKVVYSNRP
jgi:4-amino-4-deoxy-L-arabinose transferase-like glycosyltransferase